MFKALYVLGSLFIGAAFLPKTQAQIPSATCASTNFGNSEGQDVCTIGIKVGQICDPGFTIPAAGPNGVYQGTRAGATTQCVCSSIYFSLLNFCATCEGAITVPWSTYSTNCTSSFNGSFPVNLPSGLSVPHWAYIPLLTNGSLNFPAIQADNEPDVTAATSSSTSSSTSVTPSSPVSSSPTPSQSQSTGGGSTGGGGGSGTNTGAIAGGVVGGVIGLALLVALGFFLRRHFAKKQANEVESGAGKMSIPPPGWASPEGGSTLRGASYYVDNSFSNHEAPKLYNPDDPTTFPPPVHSTIIRSTSPGQPTSNSAYSAFPHTTPSEHGEWNREAPYRPDTASPEI